MKTTRKLLLNASIALAMLVPSLQAQTTLVQWDTAGDPGNQTSEAPILTASGITGGTIVRGGGVTPSSAGGSISAAGWESDASAGTTTEYFQFTINFGTTSYDLTSFLFASRSSNTGPGTLGLFYSGNSYGTAISTWSQAGTATTEHSINLTSLPTLTGSVTFRIAEIGNTQADGSGATANTGTFRIQNSSSAGFIRLTGDEASAGNNSVVTTTTTNVAVGRVIQGSANTPDNVTVTKTGSSATTYSATTSNSTVVVAGVIPNLASGNASDAITVGVDRSTTGIKSGTVTIDNLAADSAAAGQGSADPNNTITVSGTVVANRDITAEGGAIDFGKVFEDTDTASASVTLNGGTQDDNNGTRVTIGGSPVTDNGVTATYTPGQGDDIFDSANETKTISVTGNFSQSGLGQSSSSNAAGLLGNGEAGSVGATVDSSVNINYTVDVYQKALLVTDNSSPISVDDFGASVSVENAFSDDNGVRASAQIVSKQVTEGWQVAGLDDHTTVIAEGDIVYGTATFDSTGKLAGTHVGTLLLGFQHEDQTITGAAANDLGTRSWDFNYTVTSATASNGTASVQSGGSYAGYNLTSDAGLGTNVALLAGTASGATEVEMDFNALAPGGFTLAANDALRVSDVVNLTGTDGDLIVLQMSYDLADIGGALESDLRLAWFDGSDWVLAIDGNTGGTDFFAGDMAWNSGFGLGAYGVDSATNTVWAVINHNSNFSVVAIPEPATLGLLLGAGAVLMAGRRRRVSRNS